MEKAVPADGRPRVVERDGNICIGEALKSAVRLTFHARAALLKDPKHVFNTAARQRRRRAPLISVRGTLVNEPALQHSSVRLWS